MNTKLISLLNVRTAVTALAVTLGSASALAADHVQPRETWVTSRAHQAADGNLVDVEILVEGRTAPLYFRPGTWDRHYFQALKGRNYSLAVRNNTGRRVGVLIAVDGLNVVNGDRSGLSRNEPMYVLDPYERAVIRGWRTSLNDVRKFVFVDEERSYAERTGQANGDMGWIRVLSFREVETFGWLDRFGRDRNNDELERGAPSIPDRGEPEDYDSREGARRAKPESSEPRAQSKLGEESRMAPESNPGTGWGQKRYDPVRQTEFQPVARASDHLVLRYEYTSGLRALGIFPRRSRLWDREDGNLGFAQPPRW